MFLTIAETSEYASKVQKLLSLEERKNIIDYLSIHPKAGVVIRGTNGIRKLRWAREGIGKSGGVRIIYYYHSDIMPLYLLTVFSKNKSENLSKSECNDLSKLVVLLVKYWKEKSNEQ